LKTAEGLGGPLDDFSASRFKIVMRCAVDDENKKKEA
jgi:hypothetical protein